MNIYIYNTYIRINIYTYNYIYIQSYIRTCIYIYTSYQTFKTVSVTSIILNLSATKAHGGLSALWEVQTSQHSCGPARGLMLAGTNQGNGCNELRISRIICGYPFGIGQKKRQLNMMKPCHGKYVETQFFYIGHIIFINMCVYIYIYICNSLQRKIHSNNQQKN